MARNFPRRALGAAAVSIATICLASSAAAEDLFRAAISVGGGPVTSLGTSKAREIPDFFDTQTLLSIEPGYDATQAVAAAIDIRGLTGGVTYDALSNTLRFQVPGAGVDVSFDGPTREQALENFEDWLKGEFGSALAPEDVTTALLQGLVEHSPVDPVAGNPNSLQSRMFAADFRMGMSGGLEEGGLLPSRFRLDAGGGFADADGFQVYSIDAPLQGSFGFGEIVRVIVDVPVTFTSTEGAWTGMASGGLGVRVQPTSWWAITPAARFGGVGSLDVGGLAMMYSGTVTSHIRVPFGPVHVGIGNMGGVAKTVDGVELGDYSLDYDLLNWVTRNGGYVEMTLGAESLGTGIGLRAFASDVRFFGDDLYMNAYQEVGAAAALGFGLVGLTAEVAYTIGKNYDGVGARLGLRF